MPNLGHDIRSDVVQILEQILDGVVSLDAHQRTVSNRGLVVRSGSLTANLGRIRSFCQKSSSREEIRSFFEWTPPKTSNHIATKHVELPFEFAHRSH